VHRTRHSPRFRAVFVALLVVVAAVTYLWLQGTFESPDRIAQVHALQGSPSVGATTLDHSPFRITPAFAVWAADRLNAFGLVESASGVVTYSPSDGTWRQGAAPPFDTALAGAIGVSTDKEMIVIGVECSPDSPVAAVEEDGLACEPGTLAGARYDPSGDTWVNLSFPVALASAFGKGHSPTVGEAIGWTGEAAIFRIGEGYSSYSPGTGEWSRVAPVPQLEKMCVAGSQLVAVARQVGTDYTPQSDEPVPPLQTLNAVNAMFFDFGSGGWKPGPSAMLQQEASRSLVVCSPDGVYVVPAHTLQEVQFLSVASQTWTSLAGVPVDLAQQPNPEGLTNPPQPKNVFSLLDRGAWTGQHLVLFSPGFSANDIPQSDAFKGGDFVMPAYAAAFEPKSSTWQSASPGPVDKKTEVWRDGYALILEGDSTGYPALITYRPV